MCKFIKSRTFNQYMKENQIVLTDLQEAWNEKNWSEEIWSFRMETLGSYMVHLKMRRNIRNG